MRAAALLLQKVMKDSALRAADFLKSIQADYGDVMCEILHTENTVFRTGRLDNCSALVTLWGGIRVLINGTLGLWSMCRI